MYVCAISLQNVLDDRLRHANLGVVLGAVRLFLHLTDDMPNLHKDIHERMKGKVVLSLLDIQYNVHVHCTCTYICIYHILGAYTFTHTHTCTCTNICTECSSVLYKHSCTCIYMYIVI